MAQQRIKIWFEVPGTDIRREEQFDIEYSKSEWNAMPDEEKEFIINDSAIDFLTQFVKYGGKAI